MAYQKKQRSLLGHSLWIFLIRFFGTAASLIVAVFFSHSLIPSDYGEYQNLWIRLLVLSTVASAGLTVLAYTYSPATISLLLRRLRLRHYLLYLALLLLTGIAFVALDPLYSGHLKNVTQVLAGLLLFFCYTGSLLSESLLMAYRRFGYLLASGLLYALAFIAWHLYVARHGLDIQYLIRGLAVLTAIRLLAGLMPAVMAVRSAGTQDAATIHPRRVRAMWMHTFFYDTSQVIFRYLDKFVVSYLVAAEFAAVYFNGTVDIPFLPVALTAVSTAALMQLNRGRSNDRSAAAEAIRSSSSLLATITLPIFFFLFFFREEFIVFVFSDKYYASVPVFACALVRLPFYMLNVPFYLQYRQRGDLINKGALLDMALTLLLVYPMYRLLGLQGIVLSFIISSYIQLIYYARCASILLHMPITTILPVKNWLVKMGAFGALAFCLHYLAGLFLPATPGLISAGFIMLGAGALWLLVEQKRSGLVTFARKN